MAEKAELALQKQNRKGFAHFSGVFLLSSALFLNACSMQNLLPGQEEPKAADITESVSHLGPAKPLPEAEKRVNPKNLFGSDLRSDDQRLARLERAVQDMRNEFDSVKPSIKRLMAIEGDIQNLIVELRKLNEDPSLAAHETARAKPVPQPAVTPKAQPAPQYAPKAASAAPMQKKSPPPVQNGQATVFDIRTGEHSGKTRLVLDVNSQTDFNVDIDNNEQIMVIELPNASWSAATSKNFGNSAFVSSYKAEGSGSGTMLIVQLKRGAKIGYKEEMGGSNGSRRIVIDLISG